jgi:hypothetical protein
MVFSLIALWPLMFGRTVHWWSLVVAGLFGLAALVAPATLAPLNRVWTRFGLLLHRIVSPIVLGIMFFLVVTPTGFVMRLLGKDPLRLRWDRDAGSYWIGREPPGPRPDTLTDQF